jgi:hypothetical protein
VNEVHVEVPVRRQMGADRYEHHGEREHITRVRRAHDRDGGALSFAHTRRSAYPPGKAVVESDHGSAG